VTDEDDLDREWERDPEYFEAFAQKIIDAVGQFPTHGTLWEFGVDARHLVAQARSVAYPQKEPSKAAAMDAARNAADKLEKAIQAIRDFDALWENSSPPSDYTAPCDWSREIVIAEIEKAVRHFRDGMPAALRRPPTGTFLGHYVAKRMADKFPEKWAKDRPDGIWDGCIPVDTIELLVGLTLADFFQFHFGKKAAHSKDRLDKVGGPFVRFAQCVLTEAGVKIADATIGRYLASSQQTGALRYGENLSNKK
jgi:hypothetical protein